MRKSSNPMYQMRIYIVAFFLLISAGLWAEEWGTRPAADEYYKNRFQKVRFHLGVGGLFGGSYYFNYTDENLFRKFGCSLRLAQETGYGRLGLMLKLSGLFEDVLFTDDATYYGSRRKMQALLSAGALMRFRSFIPGTADMTPYLLLGGGITDLQYEHIFKKAGTGRIYNNELQGFGGAASLNGGVEISLIEGLLNLDLGFHFLVNPAIRVEINPHDEEEDKDEESGKSGELKDSITETELFYYLGFTFNLF